MHVEVLGLCVETQLIAKNDARHAYFGCAAL